LEIDEYYYEDDFEVLVKVGQIVKVKQVLAKSKIDKQKVTSSHA
jgi:hypothetical protein